MRRKANNNPSSQSGVIRIISGQFRSRKLKVHDLEGLRPTTDRVKETVFNWLMNDVAHATVLDCFAGSGGLGFEALSRYAEQVTFIELNKQAANQIKDNITLLKADNAQVVQGDCLNSLSTLKPSFDLVFVDPPFRQGLAQQCCDTLTALNKIKEDGLIYIEVESELAPLSLPSNWQLVKQKVSGQVRSELWQNQSL